MPIEIRIAVLQVLKAKYKPVMVNSPRFDLDDPEIMYRAGQWNVVEELENTIKDEVRDQ